MSEALIPLPLSSLALAAAASSPLRAFRRGGCWPLPRRALLCLGAFDHRVVLQLRERGHDREYCGPGRFPSPHHRIDISPAPRSRPGPALPMTAGPAQAAVPARAHRRRRRSLVPSASTGSGLPGCRRVRPGTVRARYGGSAAYRQVTGQSFTL